MAAERCLADFAGSWALTRRILSPGQADARFEGTAVWAEAAAGRLAYEETGTLTLAGHPPMHSTRRYVWDAALGVWFDDGRFFHTVPPGGGRATHWCDPDYYVVDYRFDDWPAFEVTWQVTGPRKDYASVTRYTRLASGSA